MLLLVRLTLAVLVASVGILTLGPFQGAEEHLGLTDKEAHAGAFFGITFLLLMALPRMRKWDVALISVALGGLVEVLQTIVGRDGDIMDFVADSAGVAMAAIPMMVETLRGRMRGGEPEGPRRRRSNSFIAPAPETGRGFR
ncbi:MAG: vanz family protein [Alphaproteobacteria bacterium]|nr:vanz family protein [Alphaproteobacteria bacterium]